MQGSLSWRQKLKHSGTNRFLTLPKSKWCGWGYTPALFLASGKRASGVHDKTFKDP